MTECVLIELIALPAEQSRGRHNPRVVKRKMSGFPTKARAAPAVTGRIIAADHIRIVAPPPDPVLLPAVVPLAAGPKAAATPCSGTQAGDGLARPHSLLADEWAVTTRLLPEPGSSAALL
ncbi:hypothetical protein [Microvirga sp. VF16]|uniref:hypothetical protein n=1 Tax=Microvirga sp. VF16 TaxID=2807101 RepID=UPI00193D2D77|nr:hypothetical protein [Microvirga sp. VF16]QRM32943.1 hypothetical protein JO965_26780 [Microvirga sp. VF16]